MFSIKRTQQKRQKVCSLKCRGANANARRRTYRKVPKILKCCVICGKEYQTTKNGHQRTCSIKCGQLLPCKHGGHWANTNPDRCRAWNSQYFRQRRSKFPQKFKEIEKNRVAQMAPSYIARLLGLKTSQCHSALAEAKRSHLKLFRLIRQLKTQNHETAKQNHNHPATS